MSITPALHRHLSSSPTEHANPQFLQICHFKRRAKWMTNVRGICRITDSIQVVKISCDRKIKAIDILQLTQKFAKKRNSQALVKQNKVAMQTLRF